MLSYRVGGSVAFLKPSPGTGTQRGIYAGRVTHNAASVPHPKPLIHARFKEVGKEQRDVHVCTSDGSVVDDPKEIVGNGYLAISMLYTASSVATLTVPQKLLSAVFSVSSSQLAVYIARAFGYFTLLLTVMLFSMRDAAGSGSLQSDEYKRFGLWAAVHGVLVQIVIMQSPLAPAKWALTIRTGVTVALFALYWKAYSKIPLLEIIPDTLLAARKALTPSSWKSGLFSLLTLEAVVEAAFMAFRPEQFWNAISGASINAVEVTLSRMCAVGLCTFALSTFTIKDGIDRKQMGRRPFKTLSLSVFLLIVTSAIVKWVVHADLAKSLFDKPAFLFIVVLSHVVYAALCSYLYITE